METSNAVMNDARATAWLNQFQLGDRSLAQRLLEAFAFVFRDDFLDHVRAMLIRESENIDGPIALYAERELQHHLFKPHRLFKETRRSVKRAYGSVGPPSVQPTKAYDRSVGSEGILTQMISQLCKEHPKKFMDHPGPDRIRLKRARAFWVVTDLIGSGQRACSYLEAAWLVRSVRSWWSGRLITFAVMAYSTTRTGEKGVAMHSSEPEIHIVFPCPTINFAWPA